WIMVSTLVWSSPGHVSTVHLEGESERARDHHALDVGCTFVYLAHTHVAIDLGQAELFQIAIAAQSLNGAGADGLRGFGSYQLGHRRFLQARRARVLDARRVQHELARGLE